MDDIEKIKNLMARTSPEIIVEALRKMIAHHSNLEQTDERKKALARVRKFLDALVAEMYGDPPEEVLEALSNDLNTPHAITIMHKYHKDGDTRKLAATMNFLGLSTI